MRIAPCKGCPERTLYCHGSCAAYIEYDQERQMIRQKNLENLVKKDRFFDMLAKRSKERHQKEHHTKGGTDE